MPLKTPPRTAKSLSLSKDRRGVWDGAIRQLRGLIPGPGLLIAVGLLAGAADLPALADDPTLAVSLLSTRDGDGHCFGTFRVANGLGRDLRYLAMDLVVLRGETEPGRLFGLALLGVPQRTPSTVVLPVDDRPCAGISRILITRVTACRFDDGDSDVCDSALSGSSETDIPLQR